MHHHNGSYIMFGDMNAVRNAQERFGITLNSSEAVHFNSFIDFTDGFDNLIKEEWELLDSNLKCHEKFRRLKDKIKQWSNNIKTLERNRKTVALEEINSIEKRIDEGSAMPSDNDHRLILLQEIEKIDKFASMDIIQKAHVKWDIEGDENSKFFHGLINQKRRNQMINGIMVEGNWITNPCLIKDAFLQFYKRKFQAQDSQVMFSNLPHSHSLNCMDRETLEKTGYLGKLKEAVLGLEVIDVSLLQIGMLKTWIISFVFSMFSILLGSQINIQSLNIYGIGVNKDEVLSMASNAGCMAGDIPFNYLGLPIGSNMKSIADWKSCHQSYLGLEGGFDIMVVASKGHLGAITYTCTWSLGRNGTFTVKDARYRIDQNILPTLAHTTTWDKSIPRKVNVFMWRLSLDRLPHRLNLSSRGMDILAISCPSCNANVESANHVFFECDIATDMWKLVFRWCDIPLFQASSWDSFNDWIIFWHASKEKKHRFYVITTSVLWWLWRYRNSVTFSSQPLRKSDLFDNVRFSSFSWLHNRDI
ncbi:RNA-directed DNA polymerase, eukaryota, reverse transcriptase zinc-binding domain protein [Tanacetum coccineum]